MGVRVVLGRVGFRLLKVKVSRCLNLVVNLVEELFDI